MLNFKLIMGSLLLGTFLFTGCSSQKQEEKTIIIKKSDIVLEKIGVDGMTCVGCEVTLEGSISKIKGVVNVKASSASKSASVSYDKTKTDLDTIVKTIQDAGYKAKK